MDLMIALPPEIESRLKGAALRCGLDVGTYAAKLIVVHVPASNELGADGPPEDEEVRPLRGFIPAQIEREVLSMHQAPTDFNDLPKWKPRVDVSRRILFALRLRRQ